MITIILPVSRNNFLNRLFTSLDNLECNPKDVNLLTIVDGDMRLFEKARNLTVKSKFKDKLCIFRGRGLANASSVRRRRQRIADIHNEAKGLTKECDYIFLTEDDTLLPENALEAMLEGYKQHPDAGFITGVQLGRWGYTTVGAYKANENVTVIQSQLPGIGLQPIDAAGFFCLLTKKETYLGHEFKPFEEILGPDSDFGLSLKAKGLQSYIDWGVNCVHMTLKGDISVNKTPIQCITFTKEPDGKWSQAVVDK